MQLFRFVADRFRQLDRFFDHRLPVEAGVHERHEDEFHRFFRSERFAVVDFFFNGMENRIAVEFAKQHRFG